MSPDPILGARADRYANNSSIDVYWPSPRSAYASVVLVYAAFVNGTGSIVASEGWTNLTHTGSANNIESGTWFRVIQPGDYLENVPALTLYREGATQAVSVATEWFLVDTSVYPKVSSGAIGSGYSTWNIPDFNLDYDNTLSMLAVIADDDIRATSWSLGGAPDWTSDTGEFTRLTEFKLEHASGAVGASTVTMNQAVSGAYHRVTFKGVSEVPVYLVDSLGNVIATGVQYNLSATAWPPNTLPVASALGAPSELEIAAAGWFLAAERLALPPTATLDTIRTRVNQASEMLRLSSLALARAGAYYSYKE